MAPPRRAARCHWGRGGGRQNARVQRSNCGRPARRWGTAVAAEPPALAAFPLPRAPGWLARELEPPSRAAGGLPGQRPPPCIAAGSAHSPALEPALGLCISRAAATPQPSTNRPVAAAWLGAPMASHSHGNPAAGATGRAFTLPSFSPEPLQALCIRFVAANLEKVESLNGLDELNVALITALVLRSLRLTPGTAALLRATGYASVIKMLEPYKAVDLIPEPASDCPTAWDGREPA